MKRQTTTLTVAAASIAMLAAACADASGNRSTVTSSDMSTQRSKGMAKPAADKSMQDKSVTKEDLEQKFIKGNRPVLGKVEAVASDQIKVDIGEVQPRFLPLKQAKEKGFGSIEEGENLIIVLNEQNLIVDYHPLDSQSGQHRVIEGEIASNLQIGHEKVAIKKQGGNEESFEIRSQARSKIASIPVGTPAIFLLDETNKIVDGTFRDVQAAKSAQQQPGSTASKSPIKGANRQVDGTVTKTLQADQITVKTSDGERPYEVRAVVHDKVSKLSKGESVILLVDNENKVIDVAIPPQGR